MQRLNGFQFLWELKQDIQLKGIPIVIYTASKHQEDLDKTKDLGAEHFFASVMLMVGEMRKQKVASSSLMLGVRGL